MLKLNHMTKRERRYHVAHSKLKSIAVPITKDGGIVDYLWATQLMSGDYRISLAQIYLTGKRTGIL